MPDILQVGLPENIEAERSILGATLRSGDKFSVISAAVDEQDFSRDSNRTVFRTMRTMHDAGQVIEPMSVAVALREAGHLDKVGGLSYLLSLDDGMGELFGLEQYLRALKDSSIRRRAIGELTRSIDRLLMPGGDTAATVQMAQDILQKLQSEQVVKPKLRRVGQIVEDAGGLQEFASPSKNLGVQTPLPRLNQMIGAMMPGELHLLAARPSIGKTALAVQCGTYAAGKGFTVPFFSLEMGAAGLVHRTVCGRSGANSLVIRRGKSTAAERRAIGNMVSTLDDLPFFIDDSPGATVPSIVNACRELKSKHGLGLVIIDYLQLIESAGRVDRNRQEEVSVISRGLKLAARQLEVPFLVLSQLSRGPEADKRRPSLTDLRESGSLEQDADVVEFLHAPYEDGKQQRGKSGAVEFIIAKQRNGPIGSFPIWFSAETTMFGEMERGD